MLPSIVGVLCHSQLLAMAKLLDIDTNSGRVCSGLSLFKKAQTCLELRQTREACQLFSAAENLGYHPDACAAGRWTCHMLRGEFESAWCESDEIARRGNPDPHRFWDGQPLQGKRVLLRCLHGLGDTLQFIRYAPAIRERASRLTVEAQPALKRLIVTSDLADEVITWGEPEPRWDQQIEIMELPRIFRTTLRSIPNDVPYLKLRQAGLDPARRGRTLRVGLVWYSSAYNRARSLPFKALEPLLSIGGVEFFSFQAGEARAHVRDCGYEILNLCNEDDLLATAQGVIEMDLVITVDTMMAHLAGALGRKVWTLLPFEGDWRWMLERSDSPWYPTMRLFRQPTPGDWATAVSRIRAEIATELEAVQVPAT